MPRGLPDSWGLWAAKKGLKAAKGYVGGGRGGRGIAYGRGPGRVAFTYKFEKLVFFEPEFDTFKHAPSGPGAVVGKFLSARGRRVVAAAKLQVGVDTGALKKSIVMIHSRHKYGQKLWIGSKLSYAYMHHEGTKPHLIVPVKAEFLRFTKGSRVIYSREVRHPGTRPNRYLSDQIPIIYV